MEEKLRVGEKGARGDIGEGSPTSKHSRVSNSEENDPGDEQLPGGPVPVRESSNRRTTGSSSMAGIPSSSATLQQFIFIPAMRK